MNRSQSTEAIAFVWILAASMAILFNDTIFKDYTVIQENCSPSENMYFFI